MTLPQRPHEVADGDVHRAGFVAFEVGAKLAGVEFYSATNSSGLGTPIAVRPYTCLLKCSSMKGIIVKLKYVTQGAGDWPHLVDLRLTERPGTVAGASDGLRAGTSLEKAAVIRDSGPDERSQF